MRKTNWIAFIGLPNVGKSTLVNQLVGEKVSIITPKAQTTIQSLRAIKIDGDTQLVFIDTPGIFSAKTPREKQMVKLAWQKLAEADVICIMVDAQKALDESTNLLMQQLKKRSFSYNLIINKIDKIAKPQLLHIAAKLDQLRIFENIFMISALKKDGIDKLNEYFLKTARLSEWFFTEDEITDAPLYFLVSETIREKIFFNTHNELPYNVKIEIVSWKKKKDMTIIHANILVKNESHKKIIIGKSGEILKKIGTQSRKEIERLVGTKIFLETHVKIGLPKFWHS